MIIHTAGTQQKNKRKKKKDRNIIHRIPQIRENTSWNYNYKENPHQQLFLLLNVYVYYFSFFSVWLTHGICPSITFPWGRN